MLGGDSIRGQSGGMVFVRGEKIFKLFVAFVLMVLAWVDDMSTYVHYFKYKPLYKGANLAVAGAMSPYV